MNIVAKTQNSAPEETGFLCTYLADICKDISRWARIVRMLGSCEPAWNISVFSSLIMQLTLMQEDDVCITCPLW